jgi:hypothetical protein
MFNKELKADALKYWVANYTKTRPGLETLNVVFTLADLTQLMQYIAEENNNAGQINAIRFYLVRQDNVKGRREVNNGHTQISLAGVPVENYDGGYGEDHKSGDNYVCIYPYPPHDFGGEHTGLCPQNCGGSLNENDNDAP